MTLSPLSEVFPLAFPAQPLADDRLLRPREVAALLGVSERQIYALMERRELGYVEVGIKGRRIRGVDVAQYIAAHRVAAVSEGVADDQ